jgi:hypothetical protein
MVGQLREDVGEPSARVDVIDLAGLGHRTDGCGASRTRTIEARRVIAHVRTDRIGGSVVTIRNRESILGHPRLLQAIIDMMALLEKNWIVAIRVGAKPTDRKSRVERKCSLGLGDSLCGPIELTECSSQ